MNTIESSSSDELQVREIRLLSKKEVSNTPAIHLDTTSDTGSHVQPLRISLKRRRTFVTSDSSDEQKKISVGKRPSPSPAEEGSSKRGKRLVRRCETEKYQLASDEAENLADEVDEERM